MLNFFRGAVLTALLGCLAYLGLFVHASQTSQERILPLGEAYHFCGFYLDCHLSAAVDGVEVVELPNGGQRYTVRVRFTSDAVRATMVLLHPQVTLLASPRLLVAKGGVLERLSERLLVGDPDSYGHAPVTLALSATP